MAVATKQPTGLTITRNGMNYTFEWKIADKDYGAGQQLQVWETRTQKWVSYAIGVGTTKKTVKIDHTKYYPYTNRGKNNALVTVGVRVRGRRKAYNETKTVKVKKKGKWVNQKKTVKQTPAWSAWTKVIWQPAVPNIPSLSAELDESLTNVCKWTWGVTYDDNSKPIFANVLWQSLLVKNSNETDGSKLSWRKAGELAEYWSEGTAPAAYSITITENTDIFGTDSYTRWFRVRSQGARGASAWRYSKHVYAMPCQAVIKSLSASLTNAMGYLVNVAWEAAQPASRPIDYTTVQWTIATPSKGLACPAGASWEDVNISRDTGGLDRAVFNIDQRVDDDECLYVRVNTIHDTNIKYGVPTRAVAGKLKDPSDVSVSLGSNFMATVSASNNSDVPDSFLVVVFRKTGAQDTICGIIPRGQNETTVSVGDWGDSDISFGVYAVQGSYKKIDSEVSSYSIIENTRSTNTVWTESGVPKPPKNVTATERNGKVLVSWDWSWKQADSAEISWSTNPDAWQSTDEPESYKIENQRPASWYLEGLEMGVRWYIRVRLIGDDAESAWSEVAEIDLATQPATPVATLSDALISNVGFTTVSWQYSSRDGTNQSFAEICVGEDKFIETEDVVLDEQKTYYALDDGEYRQVETPSEDDLGDYYEMIVDYGSIIAHTDTAQHILLSAETLGWTSGNVYNLALRVASASGKKSEWSDFASVTVAEPLTAVISKSSLVEKTETITNDEGETEERTYMALTAMPLTVTVSGAGEGGTTIVAIERAEQYTMDRPDENTFNGYQGETCALLTKTGDAEISISYDDLIGAVDDGAKYNLVATVQDGLGQSSTIAQLFEVEWTHQAIIPSATVEVDNDNYIATITPIAPEGVGAGDVCDIYRLSADRPELIIEGGTWGMKYVDPYPAIGERGGHRVVFRSVNGDYITEDNQPAWIDLTSAEEDILASDYTLIDFNGDRVELLYNVDVSSDWKKDFKETQYLGGSVTGDWNPAVSRSTSVSAVSLPIIETDLIQKMRRLATYAGICHVRTKDGSSYAADVQVSESHKHDSFGMVVDFSLSITRVDPEGFEGMTYDEWSENELATGV